MGSDHNIQSAGSQPSGSVHQKAIGTMKEIGIDISNHKSKSVEDIDQDFIDDIDYVITLCAEEVCPAINKRAVKIHWPNEDPENGIYSEEQLEKEFRRTRANIFKLLKKFFIENS